jgi:hypothetical protein
MVVITMLGRFIPTGGRFSMTKSSKNKPSVDPKDQMPKSAQDREVKRRAKVVDKFNLDNIDQQIIKNLIKFPSATNKELGVLVNLGGGSVHLRRQKPAFRQALSEIQQTSWDLLERLQQQSIRRLQKWVADEDSKVSLDAIKLALAVMIRQAGNPSTDTMNAGGGTMTFTTSIKDDGTIQKDHGKKSLGPKTDGTT